MHNDECVMPLEKRFRGIHYAFIITHYTLFQIHHFPCFGGPIDGL